MMVESHCEALLSTSRKVRLARMKSTLICWFRCIAERAASTSEVIRTRVEKLWKKDR